jgi:hypothetical protein
MLDSEILRIQIAETEARLAALDAERDAVAGRLKQLRARLKAIALIGDSESQSTPGGPTTNDAKAALFRTLFRGRLDVFLRYWGNPRTGRTGYSNAGPSESASFAGLRALTAHSL